MSEGGSFDQRIVVESELSLSLSSTSKKLGREKKRESIALHFRPYKRFIPQGVQTLASCSLLY